MAHSSVRIEPQAGDPASVAAVQVNRPLLETRWPLGITLACICHKRFSESLCGLMHSWAGQPGTFKFFTLRNCRGSPLQKLVLPHTHLSSFITFKLLLMRVGHNFINKE